ncbi:MAG: ECF transporter S component [Deltaproteobacteria bacterium]|jgi:energy-coupling factor transport system substrate-specific component|nr:ECF transporter S component [Deltaproteobacteria bacterium]
MKNWKLKDVVFLSLLAVVFAVIYLGAVYLAVFLSALLTPLGLAPLVNEFIFGVWFMAATLAGYIPRRPGAAILAETLATLLEILARRRGKKPSQKYFPNFLTRF